MIARKLTPYEYTHLARYGGSMQSALQHPSLPVEYLTGKAEFCGHVFTVSPDVLIPRVESEGLVELAAQHISTISTRSQEMAHQNLNTGKQQPATVNVLEIGTGSGAVAVSLLLATENHISLTASDNSAAALAIAKKNADELIATQQQARLTLISSDLFSHIPSRSFDLIIANLPYIPSSRLATLDASVRDHEPRTALDGGPDGFELLARLLHDAQNFLTAHGTILLEVDDTHTLTFINQQYPQLLTQYRCTAHRDCFEKHRFVSLRLKNE